jgi:HK97 family phage major capsid protein
MSDLAEVKSLFEKGQETLHALRLEFEDSQKKSADYVTEDKIKKIEDQFAAEFKSVSDANRELEARLAEAETKMNRPKGVASAEEVAETKSFFDWARGKNSDFEKKAMTEGSNPDGGYLVPAVMRDGIQERLRRTSPVRSVANVVSIGSNRYEMLVERGDAGFEWAGETTTRSDTATPDFNKISIDVHELSALPKVSQRTLDDVAFDLGGYLTRYVANRFQRAEAGAYVVGDGVSKPRGFTTYTTAATADDARGAGQLEHVATGTSGGFDASNPADKLIDVIHALQPAYRAGAVWMAKSSTAATMAKFKDGQGNYLLQNVMNGNGGFTPRVLSYPLAEAEDMPALAAGSLSLAFGNFGEGYTIVDNGAVTILRDPYSAKPFVLFYTTKRTGGGVTDFDAIKFVKFS